MSASANEQVIRRAVQAFQTGDGATLAELFHEQVRFVVPGRSPLAGDHRGREATFHFFGKLGELSGGTFRLGVVDVLGTEWGGVFLQRVSGERGAKRLDQSVVLVMKLAEGRIVECVDHFGDERAWDDFWS